MAVRYNGNTIGKMIIRQDDEEYEIQIRQGNCLAVFINVSELTEEQKKIYPDGGYMHTLYTFFSDEKYMKDMIKEYGSLFSHEVISIELNMFYKESFTLLKYLIRECEKVICYYKEENNNL